MSRLGRRPAALALSAALLAACSGGDDGSPNAAALNSAEAQAVVGQLFGEMLRAMTTAGGDLSRSPALLRAPAARRAGLAASLRAADEYTVTGDCERGGKITVRYTGTDTMDESGTGTINAAITLTPQGCVVSTGAGSSGGRTLTVNGDPSLQYSYSASFVEYELSSDASYRGTGAVAWQGGRCAMDYTYTANAQGRGSVRGTLCGQSVNQTF